MGQGNQSGFGTAEILLVVLVAMALAVTGIVVYQRHNRTKPSNPTSSAATSTSQPTSTTTTQPAQEADQNVVKVPELGIELIVPDSMKDLTYAVFANDPSNNHYISVGLSTSSLEGADSGCIPNNAPLGWLARMNGQYNTNMTNQNLGGQFVKQLSGYFIIRTTPQSTCSDKTNIVTELDTDNQTLADLNWSTAIESMQ